MYRHLVSGREISRLQPVVYYARYTRIIHSKQRCNLYILHALLVYKATGIHMYLDD